MPLYQVRVIGRLIANRPNSMLLPCRLMNIIKNKDGLRFKKDFLVSILNEFSVNEECFVIGYGWCEHSKSYHFPIVLLFVNTAIEMLAIPISRPPI